MSRILHTFPDSLFVEGYLETIENDKTNNHLFILTDIGANTEFSNPKYKKYIVGKVSTFKLFDFIKLRKMLKYVDYDKLIIHSGYLNYLLLAFIFNKKVLSKAILSLWGGTDSQKFNVKNKSKKYFLLAYFYNKIRKKIYKKIKIIMSILPEDYKEIKKTYNLNAINYPSIYPFSTYSKAKNIKKNDIVKVQICHSGSVECNTIDVIDKLKKYKSKNILVYAVLSYGNEKNIKRIRKYGREVFKDKFISIDKIMDFKEYNEYIASLDVLINNSEIQHGLGNINLAFLNGVKVYLNENGRNKINYKKEKLIFSDVCNIDNLDFYKFYKFSKENKEKNSTNKYIKSFFEKETALKKWKIVFDKEI
jgi:hypothetical protein